jgi:hypothetical protein
MPWPFLPISRSVFTAWIVLGNLCGLALAQEALQPPSGRAGRDASTATSPRPSAPIHLTSPEPTFVDGDLTLALGFLPPPPVDSGTFDSGTFGELSAPAPHVPASEIQQVQYPFWESGAQNVDPNANLGSPPADIGLARPDADCSTVTGPAWTSLTAFTYTYIPAGSQEVSWNTFDLRHQFTSQRLPGLQITPRFSWQLVGNDPQVRIPGLSTNLTDISSPLYDFALETTLRIPLGERWEILGSVAPSLFSDLRNTSHEAFRIPSRAVVFYRWSDLIQLTGGFLYLDRDDIRAAAVAGVIVGQPDDAVRLEVLYPRMKLAYRFRQSGEIEHWAYVSQDFLGGGSWAMQHSYGLDDVVTYRDEKLMLGYERIVARRQAAFIEAGYVYNRRLSFRELGYGDLKSTGMLRLGVIF